MASEKTPYLSGGIFFNLLIESTKHKLCARAKRNGDKDLYSDINLMASLITVTTGDAFIPNGDTFKKNTSDYKRCLINKSTYLDFDNVAKLTALHDKVTSKNPALYEEMKNLVSKFLSESRYIWLVKALMETIMQDHTISFDTEFDISTKKAIKKEQLNKVTQINIDCFLISVWDYILQKKKDNTLGRSTFENWYKQSATNSKWKFINENIGTTITQNIEITRFETPVYNEEKATECSKTPDMKEDSEIFNPETDIPVVEADDISNEEKQAPKQITQTINNPKIVNQYADKIYNIEHVDHLD
ncbi:hypothetical protein [uncultured Megasphaera sp.]|jgi:hypothetical protein|uniref:hypothetical protein n=1 Tax=uncultured Megasphaera sp. TaxID=165188 RepID=UPI002591B4D6|nr:hypothetical protein [uncultured Megasphaera sp.]